MKIEEIRHDDYTPVAVIVDEIEYPISLISDSMNFMRPYIFMNGIQYALPFFCKSKDAFRSWYNANKI